MVYSLADGLLSFCFSFCLSFFAGIMALSYMGTVLATGTASVVEPPAPTDTNPCTIINSTLATLAKISDPKYRPVYLQHPYFGMIVTPIVVALLYVFMRVWRRVRDERRIKQGRKPHVKKPVVEKPVAEKLAVD